MPLDLDEEWLKYARMLDDHRGNFPSDEAFLAFLSVEQEECQAMRHGWRTRSYKQEKPPMAVTPAQIDTMITQAMTEAIKQTKEQIGRRYLPPVTPVPNERVGMFVTNLRRTIAPVTVISKELQAYCGQLTRPQAWSDIGKPVKQSGCFGSLYLSGRYESSEGVWTIDGRRLEQLAERAVMSASWVPAEKQLDQMITLGLSNLGTDIKGLELKVKEAEMINDLAEKVAGDLTVIVERLVEAA